LDTSFNLYLNLFSSAESYPKRVAFKSTSNSLTYGELQARVLQAALALRENGVDARSCVALDARTALSALTATLAFALIGCKWVFASREAQENQLLFITHLVQDGPHNLSNRYKTIIMEESWQNGASPKLTPASIAGRVEPERILVIGQSSGTTGEPKFFPITADNAIRRINPKYLLDPSPIPVVASMFHVLHAAIYFVLLRVFAKGGTVVFGANKAHWLEAGVTMLMASPMHAARVIEGRAGNEKGKIPRVWLAGSPIYPSFLDQALNHFDEVINAYGAMEASIVCHHGIKHRMAEDQVVSVGPAIDDVSLEVVDETGQPVKTGEVGEVRYKTPLLVPGYIGDDEATRTFFRNGWFYPGDTGFLNSKQHLFITGRVNDLLNIGGTKLNAAAVDGIVQSTPGVTDGACFTEPGTSGFALLSVVIVSPSARDQEKMAVELMKRLAKQFAREVVPHSFYFADMIPRNENGKVLRAVARQKAQAGEWQHLTIAMD
jgi:acyl-CoA synthetase (AMP-forming)/AMP-acid ligase II